MAASTEVKDKDGKLLHYATCIVIAKDPFNPYNAVGYSQQTAHNNHFGKDSKGGNAENSMKMERMVVGGAGHHRDPCVVVRGGAAGAGGGTHPLH